MAVEGYKAGSNGIAFLVASGITYEIVAAACSSPQTTELNAGARAPTLWKWVNLGLIQAVGFVVVAAVIDRPHTTAILSGGLLSAALLYAQYWHARKSGLASSAPATEQYNAPMRWK